MDMQDALERLVDSHGVQEYGLGYAPCFSSNAGFAPPLSASYYPAYPVVHPEPAVIQHPKYVFVAKCKNCHREYHLDPNRPIPPAYCGLGMTHGCGSSEWHVLKRLIEVEADEYVDDCAYHDDDMLVTRPRASCQVGTYYAEPEPGCITLPPMTRKDADTFREKWNRAMHRVKRGALTSLWHVSDYSQVTHEDL
ncbi:unnamed protein product [marine sediment metagenome]|uniref:Uncharacterized protein n=1 Tax=marine sediment metagenome TaxID=412755 RepID=X0WKE7_9ZZZZ